MLKYYNIYVYKHSPEIPFHCNETRSRPRFSSKLTSDIIPTTITPVQCVKRKENSRGHSPNDQPGDSRFSLRAFRGCKGVTDQRGCVVPSRGVAFLPPSDISTKTPGRGNKNVQGRGNVQQWSLAFPYCFFRFRRTNDRRLTADRESQRNDRIPS